MESKTDIASVEKDKRMIQSIANTGRRVTSM